MQILSNRKITAGKDSCALRYNLAALYKIITGFGNILIPYTCFPVLHIINWQLVLVINCRVIRARVRQYTIELNALKHVSALITHEFVKAINRLKPMHQMYYS